MWQYIVKVHHAGDFCRHIFSEIHYPKLLIATCLQSECGGFIDSRHVIYVTYIPDKKETHTVTFSC